ncbi:MAG: hypothetical protein WC536_01090 [Patescibacteria group bacterium]
MKARQIQARVWDDDFVQNATWQSRYVFIYLMTCLPMNMTGVFQLTDKKIIFETGLSDGDFEIAKEELSQNKKVLFCRGWVFVVNAFKNCKVWKSESNWKAWEEEWSKVGDGIRSYFNTGVGTDVYTSQKQEIEKIKQENKTLKTKKKQGMDKHEAEEMSKWANKNVK